MKSLAEHLGIPVDEKVVDVAAAVAEVTHDVSVDALVDITDPKVFCQKILESREFREYILNGIRLGDLPPAVMCRILDHAWGKPPERMEHTGKDGAPIKTITEVRRVLVQPRDERFTDERRAKITSSTLTH